MRGYKGQARSLLTPLDQETLANPPDPGKPNIAIGIGIGIGIGIELTGTGPQNAGQPFVNQPDPPTCTKTVRSQDAQPPGSVLECVAENHELDAFKA